MFEGYVCTGAITTYQVRTLPVYMEQIYVIQSLNKCCAQPGPENGSGKKVTHQLVRLL
jgi:hypothetical protein